MDIEGTYLNIKSMYDKPTDSIILSGERWKAFPLKLGVRQGCPQLPLSFNTVFKVLAMAIRRNKGNLNWKSSSKLSWYATDTIHRKS